MKTPEFTAAEKAALDAHGEALALRALAMNETDGEGPSTIATYLDVPFRTADALINAGRKVAVIAALATLADLTLGEEVTREDLPFIGADIDKARREFTEEELTTEEHTARVEALAVLRKFL